jgi:hypothetical protein
MKITDHPEGRLSVPSLEIPNIRNIIEPQFPVEKPGSMRLSTKLKPLNGRELHVLLRGFESVVDLVGYTFRHGQQYPVCVVVEQCVICKISGVHLDRALGLVIEATGDIDG